MVGSAEMVVLGSRLHEIARFGVVEGRAEFGRYRSMQVFGRRSLGLEVGWAGRVSMWVKWDLMVYRWEIVGDRPLS